jgi:CBS domain containing-hemolysin-like protein
MTGSDVAAILIAAVLVFLAGIAASIEQALSSVSRTRAAELVEEGRAGASRLVRIREDAPRYLSAVLLLRMLLEITGTVIVTMLIAEAIPSRVLIVLVAAGVMTGINYVAIGVGPRTVGRQYSERIALLAAGPAIGLTRLVGPFTRLLIIIGNALTPGRGFRQGPFASEAELREMVDLAAQSDVIQSEEHRMIHSVFELGDTLVREVMVPRPDMVFIERQKRLRQFMSLALRSGFSRIPVIGEDLDHVVGVAYLKDVTRRVYDRHQAESTERVESVMRPVYFVPDSKPIDELLRAMQSSRSHFAIVVDEYGGTAGLVTIEDILEEIVGEITDEYDVEPAAREELGDGRVRVSSRLDLDDLAEIFGVDIDDEDVETVGGLMAKHLGKVPIPGAEVTAEGLHFVADAVAGRRNRLGTVVVWRVGSETDGGDDRVEAEPSSTSRANGQSTPNGHSLRPTQSGT